MVLLIICDGLLMLVLMLAGDDSREAALSLLTIGCQYNAKWGLESFHYKSGSGGEVIISVVWPGASFPLLMCESVLCLSLVAD